MKLLKRTWAEVSIDALHHNYTALRQHVSPNTRFLGVVKADAYGHGALPVARALAEFGAEYLAVSNLEEAIQLRKGGITTPILILGYTPAMYARELAEYDITQEIHSLEYAGQLSEKLCGTFLVLKVHLKLNTGMSRIGFCACDEQAMQQAVEAAKLPHLYVEGAFTHFSVSDSTAQEDVAYTQMQYERFCSALEKLSSEDIQLELRHCCNSGGTVAYPEYAMDMVRPGIAIYGCPPSAETAGIVDLKPVLSLYTTVSQVQNYPAGTDVGYGRRFRTERDCRVAVLSMGYADGLPRILSGNLRFLINGAEAPQIGRVCMDACMVDVTDIPNVHPGTEAVLIGADGDVSQTADRLAADAGTISYELLCGIGKRVPRLYLQNGEITEILQHIV